MAALCRQFDWSSTPLGPISKWSQSLRTMAEAVLASRFPMALFWGPELIQIYNDAYRESLGPSDGSEPRHPRALGMPAAQFWTDVWPIIGPQIDAVMMRGESVWYENIYLPVERGEGVLDDAWWTYSYSPVRDDDGSISGVLVVCLEMTKSVRGRAAHEFERKRLKELLRNAPAFMAVVRGKNHVVEMTNNSFERLIGGRDVIGKPVREALPELEGQGLIELLDQVLASGEPYMAEAVPMHVRSESGEALQQRYFNLAYQAITEADGTRSGVFLHGVDVTELMTLRAEADAARLAAEQASRAKSEFLAVMSHELRTPLNAIDGYAELLELGVHGPLTDAQRDDIARIRRSERHLLDLINSILNYTRIEAGAIRYNTEVVDLRELLDVSDAFVAMRQRAKHLTLHVEPPPAGIKVRADVEKAEQVLLNLLTNAIKFTGPDGVVGITCRAIADQVHIAVTDTGKGIPADQLERIFEPFVQVDSRLTRVQDGVGLGLAISRDLARGMGGDIVVESVPGQGSTFTFILQRAR